MIEVVIINNSDSTKAGTIMSKNHVQSGKGQSETMQLSSSDRKERKMIQKEDENRNSALWARVEIMIGMISFNI